MKDKIKKIFQYQRDHIAKIVCLILAVLLWFYVQGLKSAKNDYPVNIDYDKNLANNLMKGLDSQDHSYSKTINDKERCSQWWLDSIDLFKNEWNPGLISLLDKISELFELFPDEELANVRGLAKSLDEIDQNAFAILGEASLTESSVTWVESTMGHVTAICLGNIETSSLLQRKLYQNENNILRTLVMVSAT